LAEKMTADYCDCLKRLNVTGIDLMPRATEHIGEMLEMMKGLIDHGHAYPSGGDVYFDVSKDVDYGKLCHRDPEQMEAGARVEISDRKRNPGDFALWKGAKPGEPSWDSPWGPGRPGWHIECSAMSMKYLGKTLDIHGGGLDLQFPHHENELAQSESYTNQTFAHYWMHNGLLKMGNAKMAGSVGNVVNVVDLLKKYHPETVRFLLLSTHYRSPIEYSDDRLAEVRRSLDGFYRFFERYQRVTGASFHQIEAPARQGEAPAGGELLKEIGALRKRFLECMDDDFNTGGAVGVLYEMLNKLNRFADDKKLEDASAKPQAKVEFAEEVRVLKEMSQILGIFQEPVVAAKGDDDQLVGGLMQLLIDLRAEARKAKNFALGDQIRKRLTELGVTLEDRPTGTAWRVG
jgi:cysteinyl-tRNA synthetase